MSGDFSKRKIVLHHFFFFFKFCGRRALRNAESRRIRPLLPPSGGLESGGLEAGTAVVPDEGCRLTRSAASIG